MAVGHGYPKPDILHIKKNAAKDQPVYSRNEEKIHHYNDQTILHRKKKRNRVSILLIINVLLLIIGGIIVRVLTETDTAYKEQNGYSYSLLVTVINDTRSIQLKIINKSANSAGSGKEVFIRFFVPERESVDIHKIDLPEKTKEQVLITSKLPAFAGDSVVSAEVFTADFSFTLTKKK
ncbi:MAG: hypothetical protein JW904_09790 [Spirochaetales bacterium]|nr:hypothetical protein [Spirochaetales bacterium]